MNKLVMTILGVAFVLASLASWAVYRAVRSGGTGASSGGKAVIVATRALEAGTVIKEGDVRAGQWPGNLPKGAITKREDAIGRGVVTTILEGEPVVELRLARPGAGGGLAALIPSGKRACAVRVNEVVGLAGFVVPGLRVDVVMTGTPPNVPASEGPVSKTILQNVEVLSSGQNIQKDAEGRPAQTQVVNLLVTPEEAEILSLASNETKIQLVLRNQTDTEHTETAGSSLGRLFEGAKPAPLAIPIVERPKPSVRTVPATPPPPAQAVVPPLPPTQYVIEVINGPRRDEAKFQKPEGVRQ